MSAPAEDLRHQLLRYWQRVIGLNAELPGRAFELGEGMARERILRQRILDPHGESVDASAHIDQAGGEINLHIMRTQRNDACSP